MSAKRIRVDVDVKYKDTTDTLSCFFDRINPFPLAAYQAYLAERSEADAMEAAEPVDLDGDGDQKVSPGRFSKVVASYASLFDASCIEAKDGEDIRPLDQVPYMVKVKATQEVMANWASSLKA